jgi:hypothetical protein
MIAAYIGGLRLIKAKGKSSGSSEKMECHVTFLGCDSRVLRGIFLSRLATVGVFYNINGEFLLRLGVF